MKEKKQMDLLHGSLWDKILLFALPLAASSFIQQLFNAADSAVVGHYAGSAALAAVGSVGSFVNLLINLFVGLSIGTNVVIAQGIGEGNEKKVKDAVHTSVLVAIICGLILIVLGEVSAPMVLRLISSPPDVINLSKLYLRIFFLGMPFSMLYNFSASILRSIGDTRRPIICLSVAGVVNVVLNLILVVVFNLSVAGVAIATVVSNMISAFMLIRILTREKSWIHLNLKELRICKPLLVRIARIGLPAGFQGAFFSLSNVIIQSSINSLGSVVIAACTVALNFEYLAYFVSNAFNNAGTTFIGQNYGANQMDRCKRVTRWTLLLGSISTVSLSCLMLLFANPLAHIFTNSEEVVHYAIIRMYGVLSYEALAVVMEILSGIMRGYGYSLAPSMITAVGACVFRIVYRATVLASKCTFERVVFVYPASWVVTVVAMIIAYFIIMKRVMKEKRL